MTTPKSNIRIDPETEDVSQLTSNEIHQRIEQRMYNNTPLWNGQFITQAEYNAVRQREYENERKHRK